MTSLLTTSVTARRTFMPGSDADPDQLLQLFTPDELLHLIYPPLLATEAALHYATRIADLCAARRLEGTKRTCRELREAVRTYKRQQLTDLNSVAFETLQRHFDLFLGHCGSDVQTLWFTVNQELKTRYPHLADYDLATEVMVCMSLADYAVRCDTRTALALSDRTGLSLGGVNYTAASLRKTLKSMVKGLSIDGAPMVELAVKVIDCKMKDLDFLLDKNN